MDAFSARLNGRLLRDEPLARFTAARLGGAADWVYIAKDSIEELVEVVTAAWAQGLPVRVLGSGANVLVSDQGVRGLVVINDISRIETGDWHDGRNLSATAGVNLTSLARKCGALGFAGMEWAVSVPGTVGGAIVNNAGAHGTATGDTVADVVVYDADRGVQFYHASELAFGYRTSSLKARPDRRFVVLLATFCLTPDDPDAIQARMTEFNAYRKRTQPPGASLGSVFKNPAGDAAGRLIESAGLKGWRIGAAQVSPIHANFFINEGAGSASDYRALVLHVRDVVYARCHVLLEPEIEFIGEW
ncbi:MAG: UDP-N-acetylmuramate dehydrogenase [Armatimonadetes bacterium]|nr:UDP-N-acetylmuramate dehydrogenase [Anaerolineae bacterium]